MGYQRDRRQEWIDWFLDPQNASEAQLRAAFPTVPTDEWSDVWVILQEALFQAKDELMP
jgi:hypothetical protein